MKTGEILNEHLAHFGKPLEGLRVLAIEQMQALPYSTQLLGHLGADIVKVEHPTTGDSGRGSLPAVKDDDGRDVGATYLRNNLNKRSITCNLKSPEGVDLIKRLVPKFDIVAENFKAGTMARLGLAYDDLKDLHPGLIYVSVSGFGNLRPSPYQAWGAYAPIAEAMGGFIEWKRGEGELPELGPAGALGDIGTSLFATIGLLSALHRREKTGRGQYVDVAMYDAMVAMADAIPHFYSLGMRKGGKRRMAAGIVTGFKADDGYFIVQCVRDHQLEKLAHAVGHPEWLDDPRLETRGDWADQLESLIRPAIEAWAEGKTMIEAATELNNKGVVSGPCNGPEQLMADPHVRDHAMLLEVERPDADPSDEPVIVVGNPIKLSEMAEGPNRRWPQLGAHTEEVLAADLGLSSDDVAALREKGAV